MKKFIVDHINVAIIITSALLLFLLALVVILATKKHNATKGMSNEYIINEEKVELAGTKVVSNDNLSAEQCLNDICVSNVVVYSTTSQGRVECTITNNSEKEKSGYLKIVLGDKKLVLGYKKLAVGDSITTTSQFNGYSLQDIDNYSLEKLTNSERKAIVK